MALAMDSVAGVLANELALVARAPVEPAAFAAIYDHYFPRIHAYVSYRVREAATADDLTATIFARALAKISSYRPDGAPFAVWLFAIARNAVSDHLRREARHRWLSLDVVHDWVSGERTPDEVVIAGEAREALRAAMQRLSERERDLLALKFGAQLT